MTRLWFAFACFARVLFDGSFAGRAWLARGELARSQDDAAKRQAAPELRSSPALPDPVPSPAAPVAPPDTSALQLLALLQTSGRFLDFLEEDVAAFADADLGAAARVVHEGCRKSVRQHVAITPVRAEEEGARVTVERGYDATATKLTGNVRGDGPWVGTVRHRGWRAGKLSLPTLLPGVDATVLAPAEVEL